VATVHYERDLDDFCCCQQSRLMSKASFSGDTICVEMLIIWYVWKCCVEKLVIKESFGHDSFMTLKATPFLMLSCNCLTRCDAA
jgi:hypothetical protein